MEFSGSQKINASQEAVFQALLDPQVWKECIPGCTTAAYEAVEWDSGRYLKVGITPNFPGFSGSHDIYVKVDAVTEPSHLVFVTKPNSSLGSINATCSIDLLPEGAQTLVNYTANAVLEGKIAATPEFVIKTGVKGAVDHFFKNLEKHFK